MAHAATLPAADRELAPAGDNWADSDSWADIRLVATDLDGTLIGKVDELPLFDDFSDRIDRLRQRNGAVWVACTGRTFPSFAEFFLPMRQMGISPDYVIIRHAFIYRHTAFGFIPHVIWNISILSRLWREGLAVRSAINEWHQALTGGATGVSTVRRSKRRLTLRFESEASAVVAEDILKGKTKIYRHLRVYRRGRDVDVCSVPATKGMALSELASYLGIDRAEMLAIGNGDNDISMLDGEVAAMSGCPANSERNVIAAVHHANGHVASRRSLSGVIEIIDAFAGGEVRSDLPGDWESAVRVTEAERKARTRGLPRRRRPSAHPLLFTGVAYVGLLVFACFNVLPFSAWIRKPLDLLIDLGVWIASWF
jgi:hydroxymethylpyrimidine pyrophosphatase-like HAD family hydrolase